MTNLLVTGSIAFDRIAVFRDHFKNHILPDKVHMLNVAFTVDNLSIHFGGTGGNIAYNLTLLGERPHLAGTVGSDFGDYRTWLTKRGVRLEYVKELPDLLTAQASVTTDLSDNQITAFYAGAMLRAEEARVETLSDVSVAVISPNGKAGMLYYADHCRARGIPFIADPGQAIPVFSGEELRRLIAGASVLIANDYEWSLILGKLRIKNEELRIDRSSILQHVEHLIITYGEQGSKIWSRGGGALIEVPAVKAEQVADPTGCGDAYRAGLMFGLSREWEITKAARLGAWLAGKAVEKSGTQNHALKEGEMEGFLGIS